METHSDPTFVALVDDSDHARDLMKAWLQQPHPSAQSWVLVACAPRMTHRISKWVSHSSREHWRDKWAEKLFLQLLPLLRSKGHGVRSEVARGPVQEWVQAIEQRGPCQVLDWRKPRNAQGFAALQQGRVHWSWLPALAAVFAMHEVA